MINMDFLPYGKQSIDRDDLDSVAEALESDWLTTGPRVEDFERALAEKAGVEYAVAFNSGTAALHAAYFAAGVGPGDEVITSPITFAATANAAVYLGARPVFADVRSDTVNINEKEIGRHITDRTRVLAPVDFAGHPAEMDHIINTARENSLVVVEDACHALGAGYRGRPVGSLADITIFSFHPVKHITTGEGGAAVTNSREYCEKMKSFRSHGMVRDREKLTEYHGPWYHEMHMLGYNYRITDIQCALGNSQLKKLDSFLKKRQDIVDLYNEELSSLGPVTTPVKLPGSQPAWHLYVVRVKGGEKMRLKAYEELHKRGIGVQVHYLPVYRHPYYLKKGYARGLCPVAEDYYSSTLSLPLYPGLTLKDANRVAGELKNIINALA